MEVELLWFPGCPSWRKTESRLRRALALAGAEADLVLVELTTAEDAGRLRGGSPTVLVDGEDLFADESAPVGLACRVFRTPDGLQGAPTVDQLVSALRSRHTTVAPRASPEG